MLGNVAAASQSGAATSAYIAVAINLSKTWGLGMLHNTSSAKKNVHSNAQNLDGKGSFLTNPRVYTKLTSTDDTLWLLRALIAAAEQSSTVVNSDWGQALLYIITGDATACKISPNTRQEASKSLEQLCIRSANDCIPVLAESLWHWLRAVALEEKDSPALAARTGRSRLHHAFRPICKALKHLLDSNDTTDNDGLRSLLIQVLVLCRDPLIPRVPWIDICIRSGVDPSSLVSAHSTACLTEARGKAQVGQTSSCRDGLLTTRMCRIALTPCETRPSEQLAMRLLS